MGNSDFEDDDSNFDNDDDDFELNFVDDDCDDFAKLTKRSEACIAVRSSLPSP